VSISLLYNELEMATSRAEESASVNRHGQQALMLEQNARADCFSPLSLPASASRRGLRRRSDRQSGHHPQPYNWIRSTAPLARRRSRGPQLDADSSNPCQPSGPCEIADLQIDISSATKGRMAHFTSLLSLREHAHKESTSPAKRTPRGHCASRPHCNVKSRTECVVSTNR